MSTTRTGLLLLALFLALQPGESFADKVCLKLSLRSGKVRITRRAVTTPSCPRGFKEVVDTSTLTGPTGATGPAGATGATGAQGSAGVAGTNGTNGTNGADGADGALRVWGNGDDGALTPADASTLDPNKQYTNINILSGRTVFVKSGSVIRCTGTFTIDGILVVRNTGTAGRIESTTDSNLIVPIVRTASSGSSQQPAPNGPVRIGISTIPGASNSALTRFDDLRNLLRVRPGDGGGAGGGALGSVGGPGGGAVSIFCKTAVTISGTISADGQGVTSGYNGGGGAGGIVVLATNGAITHSGSITATGANGGSATSIAGAGGGGAGGVIHLIAPTLNVTGALSVVGGSGGSGGGSGTLSGTTIYGGGGAGGNLISSGGDGGGVLGDGTAFSGQNGNDGDTYQTIATSNEIEALLF